MTNNLHRLYAFEPYRRLSWFGLYYAGVAWADTRSSSEANRDVARTYPPTAPPRPCRGRHAFADARGFAPAWTPLPGGGALGSSRSGRYRLNAPTPPCHFSITLRHLRDALPFAPDGRAEHIHFAATDSSPRRYSLTVSTRLATTSSRHSRFCANCAAAARHISLAG